MSLLGDEASNLPQEVYRHLTGVEVANHKAYDSVDAAEADFCLAWLRAVEEGWDPEQTRR
jgi:hypothetical protein